MSFSLLHQASGGASWRLRLLSKHRCLLVAAGHGQAGSSGSKAPPTCLHHSLTLSHILTKLDKLACPLGSEWRRPLAAGAHIWSCVPTTGRWSRGSLVDSVSNAPKLSLQVVLHLVDFGPSGGASHSCDGGLPAPAGGSGSHTCIHCCWSIGEDGWSTRETVGKCDQGAPQFWMP